MSKRLLSTRRMSLRSKLWKLSKFSKLELLEARRLLSGGHGHNPDGEQALDDVPAPLAIIVTTVPTSITGDEPVGGDGISPVITSDVGDVNPLPILGAPVDDGTTVDDTQVTNDDRSGHGRHGRDDETVPPTDSTDGNQNDQGQDDGNLVDDDTSGDQPMPVVDSAGIGNDGGGGDVIDQNIVRDNTSGDQVIGGVPVVSWFVGDGQGDGGNASTGDTGDGGTTVAVDDGSGNVGDTGDGSGGESGGDGGGVPVSVVDAGDSGIIDTGDLTSPTADGGGDGGDNTIADDLLGGGDTTVATDDSGSHGGDTSGGSDDSTTTVTTISEIEPVAPPPQFSDDPITIVSTPPLHVSLPPASSLTTTGNSHATSEASHTVQQAVTPPVQELMPVLASSTTSSTPTFVSELAAIASGSDAKVVAHHADSAAGTTAQSQQASQNGQAANVAAKSSAVTPPAPRVAPSAPPQPGDPSRLADVIDIQVTAGPDGTPILSVRDDDGSLAALLKKGRRYGNVAGGEGNLDDTKPGPNYFRRVTVDAEAVGDSWQVDPTAAAASVAVFTLPAEVKTAVSIGDQVLVQQSTMATAKKPLAAASLTPTAADIRTNSSRSFLAAAAAGVAVVAIQLHQWRKRKLTAAANKLAGLLQFDPLAVWLDGSDDKDR